MADATGHLESHEETSTLHHRLQALFAAFWEKLESKLTLPALQSAEAPSKRLQITAIKVLVRRRRQRLHRQRTRKAAANTAECRRIWQHSTIRHMWEMSPEGERGGKQTQNPQLTPLAIRKEAHTMWDYNFPVQGIG
ncbi:Hypothetical predicted protein [Pelobates cultripes]|nr:Hypothetical predicted protein [Pelobates cultripes]